MPPDMKPVHFRYELYSQNNPVIDFLPDPQYVSTLFPTFSWLPLI